MYSNAKRFIAYVLLISHSLMSCYNLDIGRPKQLLQQSLHPTSAAALLDQAEEELPIPFIWKEPSLSVSAEIKEIIPDLLNNESTTSTYLLPQEKQSTWQEIAKKVTSPTQQLRRVLLNEPKTLSISQQAVKIQPNQAVLLPSSTQEAPDQGEQLTPGYLTRKGIQVQFVENQPHALRAKVVDQFGMCYQVPVRYENNIPLSLEDLIKKGAYPEWCKSNLHVLNFQDKKCVYVGELGLKGGIEENDCPYRAKVSEGSSFTDTGWTGRPTHQVYFYPYSESEGTYWRGRAKMEEYTPRGGGYFEDWGPVFSNYSELSEEELRACSKQVNYRYNWWTDKITNVRHILAYLSSSDRVRIQKEKEERREREAKRLEEERKRQEEEQRKKEEKYAKEHAIVLEQRDELVRECIQLHTNNDQTAILFSRVAQLHENNLVTAKKLQESQQDNLITAQRLSQNTTDLAKKLQETKQSIQDLQEQKSKDEQRKKELDQRIGERRNHINKVQKVLEDLKAGRIEFKPSKEETRAKDSLGSLHSFLMRFATVREEYLEKEFKTLEEESKYQSQLQTKIKALEQVINKEVASLQEDERQVTKIGEDLTQKLAQEVIRKEDFQKIEQQINQNFEQRKQQLNQELTQLEQSLQKVKQSNEATVGLAKEGSQAWDENKTVIQQLLEVQEKNYTLAQQLPIDALEIFNQLQAAKQHLTYVQEQQIQSQKRQEALINSANQRQQQIEVFDKKLEELKSACNIAKPVKDVLLNELKTKDQLQQEVETLEKALAQEKASLQQELEEAQNLQSRLSQQVNQAASKKQEFVQLEKQLGEAFHKKRSQLTDELAQIEKELRQFNDRHGSTQELINQVSQIWENSEQLAGALVDRKRQTKEAVGRILPNRTSVQDILQEQLEEAQQKLQQTTEQKKKAQRQEEDLAITIKHREKHIQQLQQQIVNLSKQYHSTNPPREKTLEGPSKQQEQLHQQLRELMDQVTKEQMRLQEEHKEATHVQEQLLQGVREEEEKLRKLATIEKDLQARIREGEELEKEIQQALAQELARHIEADKKTEILIKQLRQEANVLRGKKAPQHLINGLEELIQQGETLLQEKNQRLRNQSHASLQEKLVQLKNAQSMREAVARRQVEMVNRLLAIKEGVHQEEKREWEEENQRKMVEEIERLEQLRKQAEEDRQRAAKRDQEDEENERRSKEIEQNKPWYEKAWNWVRDKAKERWEWVKENPWKTAFILGGMAFGGGISSLLLAIPLGGSGEEEKQGRRVVTRVLDSGSSGGSGWSKAFTTVGTAASVGVVAVSFIWNNRAQINNLFNGRGWKTDEELQQERHLREQEAREAEEKRCRKQEEEVRMEEERQRIETRILKLKEIQHKQAEAKKKQEIHKQKEEEVKRKVEEDRRKKDLLEEVYVPKSITETEQPLPQQASTSPISERMQQELSNLTNKVKSIFQQFTPSKEATAVTNYTKQSKELLDNLSKSGHTSELTTQATTLLEKMGQLAEDIQVSQQAVEMLKSQHILFKELKEHLEGRSKDLQANLNKLKQAKEQLQEGIKKITNPQKSSKEQEEFTKEEIEDIIQEEKEYEELAQGLTSPEFTHEIVQESQQAVKDLLSQGEKSKGQAQELAEGLADQIGPLLSIKQKLEVISSLTSPGSALEEIHQQLIQVEKRIDKLKTALKELCEKFKLPMPALVPTPPISKETIKKVVGQVLDVTVPGSELIKILSGLSDSPQSQEGWLKLALDTALDFMPGGKILKFLKGNAARLGIKQIESQILKLAAKRAQKAASKAIKLAPELLSKLQNIFKPGGKVIGKQLGSDPTIRTLGKEEAEKIIKQLMEAGAKKVNNPKYNKGTWYELPGGGGGFGMRTSTTQESLRHGTPHTIDVQGLFLEGIDKLKY